MGTLMGLEGKKKVFLVCDGSLKFPDKLNRKLDGVKVPVVHFFGFQPNPSYESVLDGARMFREQE